MRSLTPHLRYLRYVLRHKWYVLRAGHAISRHRWNSWRRWLAWYWRLLAHDLSKFSPIEWTPYVQMFYGDPAATHPQFDRAWLHHLHANAHHWQHWILREDDGRTRVLLPDAMIVDEMVADWLAAGPKVHHAHTMAHAVAETIVWYAKGYGSILVRKEVRDRIERTLLALAEEYGVYDAAQQIATARATKVTIEINAWDARALLGRQP